MLRLRQHGLEWRQVDDEVVALDLETARYLATNRTGALLWDELAAGATREALIDRLMDRWDLDEARAAADVDAFLAMLTDRGLLEST
ncbi:MAG TPA: PqqD family protein [Egibacteraceae bacterium]|nr:PqqD family protein [Egibacteraceae bacterium]